MSSRNIILVIFTLAMQNLATAAYISGKYTGNGSSSQKISGLGFKPEVVLVKSGNMQDGWIATSTMSTGYAKLLNTNDAPNTGYIQSLDSDGFTVSSSSCSNSAGVTYYYTAWDDADGSITVGSFTPVNCGAAAWQTASWYSPGSMVTYLGITYHAKNGHMSDASNRPDINSSVWTNLGTCSALNLDINTIGYRPEMIWILGEGITNQWDEVSPAQFTLDNGNSNHMWNFTQGSSLSNAEKIVDDLTNTGFLLRPVSDRGTHDGPANGVKYNYVTFKPSNYVQTGTYTGTSLDDTYISALEPQFIMIKDYNGGQNVWFRTTAMGQDTSYKFTGDAQTSAIKDFINNGFTLGVNGEMNSAGKTYEYIIFGGIQLCGDTSLKASIPNQCSDIDSLFLNQYKITTEAGSWSIVSKPALSSASISKDSILHIKNGVSGLYTLQFHVTANGNGCPNNPQRSFYLKQIPSVHLSDTFFCEGNFATLDAGSGKTSYTWTGPNGFTADTRQIQANQAGNYLVITDSLQCNSAPDSAQITLRKKPLAPILFNDTICESDSTQLDANNTYAKYAWYGPNNFTSANKIISVKNAGTYLLLVDSNTCTSDTAKALITVNKKPLLNNIGNKTICNGDTLKLSLDANAGNYWWTGPNNFTGDSNAIEIFTAGNYTVILDSILCSSDVVSFSLAVNPLPNINLGSDFSICVDSSVTLNAALPNATYHWYPGNSNSSNITVNSEGLYKVSVTVNNCSSSDSIQISVLPLPYALIGMDKTSYCENDSIILSASNNNYAYHWILPDGTQKTQDSVHFYTAGQINLHVVNPNTTCSSDTLFSLAKKPLPVFSLNDTSKCVGIGVSLQPTPANFKTFKWTTGDSTAQIFYAGASTQITLSVNDSNHCSYSKTINIYLKDSLSVNIDTLVNICENENTSIVPNISNSFTPPLSYAWNNGQTSPSLKTANAGFYQVQITDAAGCVGTAKTLVNLHQKPQLNLGNDTVMCFGAHEKLNLSFNNAFQNIQWWNNNLSNNFQEITAPGTYWLKVQNEFGCETNDSITITEYCDPVIICMPNVVTPNGDGQNDILQACKDKFDGVNDGNYKKLMDNIQHIDFKVFDRWGVQMFISKDILPAWDMYYGNRLVSQGVYYYVIHYEDSSNHEYTLNGWVEVIY